MEKPRIIIDYENNIETLKAKATENGREFDFANEVSISIKQWIQRIKVSVAPTPYIQKRRGARGFNSSAVFDIPQLEYALEYLKHHQYEKDEIEGFANGTTRQSTLACYYMMKASKFPRSTGNKTEDAKFIKFLIGKDYDQIRKLLGNPLKRTNEKTGKATERLIQDLMVILNQFEKIHFNEGIVLIENDINTLQQDLNSFNDI